MSLLRFFVLLLTVYVLPLCAHVIQTDSFKFLERDIPDLNQHDLVLFDYDKTLLMPCDALLQTCGKRCLRVRLKEQAPHLSPQKVEELISVILLNRSIKLVDPRSCSIIQAIQNQGAKVFVLTALRTGSFGHIPRTENWRLQELYNNGFDFRSAFPEIHRLDFKEYRKCPHPPVYVQGLFCSGSVPKGEALHCFFKQTGYRPRRIIFIDNAADHHNSVEKWARRLKIPYLGYHYTAAFKKLKRVDEQIANFQIRYLIDHEEWIDDQEAKRRLQWSNTPT